MNWELFDIFQLVGIIQFIGASIAIYYRGKSSGFNEGFYYAVELVKERGK